MKKNKNRAIAITLVAALVFVIVIAGIIAVIAKPPAQKEEAPASSQSTYSKPVFDIPDVEESAQPESTESSEVPPALEIMIDDEEGEIGKESVDRDTVSLPKFEEPEDYGPAESD